MENTTQQHYTKGDQVVFLNRARELKNGQFSHYVMNGTKAYIRIEGGGVTEIVLRNVRKASDAKTAFELKTPEGVAIPQLSPKANQFDVNQRFNFLAQLTRMVINKTAVSLIVTGMGGIGKSYVIKREIMRKRLVKYDDYVSIKGFSTPRGLYRILWENNGKLIVFDDCDEVLEDKIAKNLLKGALDSYDEREIHWITKTSDESLPDSFDFTGQVIFISNKGQDSIDQAILSRAMCIDLTLSQEDLMKRMEFIIETSKDFMPSFSKEMKIKALDIIKENLEGIGELSLRSLEKVLKILAGETLGTDEYETDGDVAEPVSVEELAKFMLLS